MYVLQVSFPNDFLVLQLFPKLGLPLPLLLTLNKIHCRSPKCFSAIIKYEGLMIVTQKVCSFGRELGLYYTDRTEHSMTLFSGMKNF